jgi:hypothetical protein
VLGLRPHTILELAWKAWEGEGVKLWTASSHSTQDVKIYFHALLVPLSCTAFFISVMFKPRNFSRIAESVGASVRGVDSRAAQHEGVRKPYQVSRWAAVPCKPNTLLKRTQFDCADISSCCTSIAAAFSPSR